MRKILRLLCRKNNRKWILLVVVICVIVLLFLTVESWILPDRFTVSRYDSAVVKPGFAIKPPFSFSEPQAIKPVRELVKKLWMKDLTDILSKRSSKQVILLVVEREYYESLLNWLVAFEMNTKYLKLDDILIISLDERVCNILKDKTELSTVCVYFNQIIRYYNILYSTKYAATWDIMIVRMALVRLLNHWGYNVLVIDLDAIVLKDPFPLLDKYPDADIITSFSITSLRPNVRGICFGFLLLKSTEKVEYLWEVLSNRTEGIWKDQVKLYGALNHGMKTIWTPDKDCNPPSTYNHHCNLTGITNTGLKVIILSHDLICRSCIPAKRDQYYVWHNNGRKNRLMKQQAAKKGSAWFLRQDWMKIAGNSKSKGRDWIHELSISNV